MRTDGRVMWALRAWIAGWGLAAAPVWAVDHDNLDAGRPVRIEDAYPIAKGEIGVESGVAIRDGRGDGFGYGGELHAAYGIWYNTQVEIGGEAEFEGSSAGPTDRGSSAMLGVLYNFNAESLEWPAFAVRAEVVAPGGEAGADPSAGLILTRAFGRLRTHLNAAYTVSGSAPATDRRGRYEAVLGASYPLGYPMRFRETAIADVFTRQSSARGAANATGLEVGVRHQFSHRVVLDVGAGSELFGPEDRAVWYGTVGVSAGF
jgi:hypothetical protein